ncbi:MAG: hypothetical protein OXC11_09440 [Rhodospirillales bacterium]|nr:hypothetical protein [Rhodospirillales bacterium]
MTKNLKEIVTILDRFKGESLTKTIASIEEEAEGLAAEDCEALLATAHAEPEVLEAAAELKRLADQVDVIIHAVGILLCLPRILEAGETVESLSLGAGNTGRSFDLETNLRVAEFKFTRWRGGPETIRQNETFKDFYLLAANPTQKRKQLFLLGTQHAEKFFRGERALESVLSTNKKVREKFFGQFDKRFRTVGDYYAVEKGKVEITDMSRWVKELKPV